MIKVLIVEDEPPIARALKKLIGKVNPEFEVVGIADNGKEAIRLYEEFMPKVVFTDIRMPVLDGFGFLEYLDKKEGKVYAVILSGYSDFEYAREGIRYKVYDYLLKTISVEKLENLLSRLELDIGKEERQSKNELIRDELYGLKGNKKEILFGSCMVGLICAGSFPDTVEDVLLPGVGFWAENRCGEILDKIAGELDSGVCIWEFSGITAVERIVILEGKVESCTAIFSKLYEYLNVISLIPITSASHQNGIDISSVGSMAAKLRNILYEKLIFGRNSFILLDRKEETPDTGVERVIKKITARYREQKPINKTFLEEFCRECEKKGITQTNLLRCLNIIASFFYGSRSMGEEGQTDYDIRLLISDSYHYDHLLEELKEMFTQPREGETVKNDSVLEAVREYLENHYSETVTNEGMAQEFGFATSYLCRIFKAAYGTSPGNYLIRLRMDCAKRLLKEQPDMKIREVAERTGYKDQYYFSKAFYKETGMWPTQYK